MEEKLALWKANKKSKTVNNYLRSSQTQPLRLRTNIGKITDIDAKKPLPNPKLLTKKDDKQEHSKIKCEDENITRLLPESIIQSALSIVDSLQTPPRPASTPSGLRIKPLPSPHLLIMDAMEESQMSRFTQTIQDESEKEQEAMTRYNDLMALYQIKTEQVQKLSDQLSIAQERTQEAYKTSQSKDEEISQLIGSNEDLQEKLVLLKKAYDKLEKQANEWQTDVVSLQSSILEEFESKSLLKEEIQQISAEKFQLENDLFEFNQLLEDMKTVASESEVKDDEIMKLEIRFEESQEQILALEAQNFKKEQDLVEFKQEFQDLQEAYHVCMTQIQSVYKDTFTQETQTSQVYMESIFTQTSDPNHDELSRNNVLLRMNNSVLSQQLEQAQKVHKVKILEMKQQMDNENQKWQEIELSQATMHRKLIDALEKTVAKNKELKRELEKKN